MKAEHLQPAPKEVHHGRSLQLAMAIQQIPATEVAEHLGVTRQSVHKLADTKTMKDERLLELAELFNITIKEFVELPHHPVYSTMFHHCAMAIMTLRKFYPTKGKYFNSIENHFSEALAQIKNVES